MGCDDVLYASIDPSIQTYVERVGVWVGCSISNWQRSVSGYEGVVDDSTRSRNGMPHAAVIVPRGAVVNVRLQYYLAKAEECEQLAEDAHDGEAIYLYRDLARQWRMLADQLEHHDLLPC